MSMDIKQAAKILGCEYDFHLVEEYSGSNGWGHWCKKCGLEVQGIPRETVRRVGATVRAKRMKLIRVSTPGYRTFLLHKPNLRTQLKVKDQEYREYKHKVQQKLNEALLSDTGAEIFVRTHNNIINDLMEELK